MEQKKRRKFYGREITEVEIETIAWIIDTYKSLSRTELIYTISEALEWTRAEDGNAKYLQCRVCLESLESEGVITLPKAKTQTKRYVSFLNMAPPPEAITEVGPLELRIPQGVEENKRWRSYLQQYHPLGYKREYGIGLRYLIISDKSELGCIHFAPAAWSLEARDGWIGWSDSKKEMNLRLIINNMRYLLLPWVRSPNLASRSLGMAARQVQGDWLRTYGYAPVMLETFVDSTLYSGTCYKAANWIQVGETKGRGRNDRHNDQELSIKYIFVYPLQRDFREVLLGQKPFRRIEI